MRLQIKRVVKSCQFIVYRNGKWYASITVDVLDQVLKPDILPTGAVGIDLGCKSALSITDVGSS